MSDGNGHRGDGNGDDDRPAWWDAPSDGEPPERHERGDEADRIDWDAWAESDEEEAAEPVLGRTFTHEMREVGLVALQAAVLTRRIYLPATRPGELSP